VGAGSDAHHDDQYTPKYVVWMKEAQEILSQKAIFNGFHH
jgi:hypothetical protein